MAEAHDQKEFLELLYQFRSEETKKARRNASLISFIVISAQVVRVRIADIKVLGIDLSKSSDLPVLLIALVLLVYWLVMFLLSYSHDKEIQKERSRRLELQAAALEDRWKIVEKRHIDTDGQKDAHDYREVKGYVEALNAQRQRTTRAARFGGLIGQLELYVPLGLSIVALFILGIGISHAL